MPFECEMCGKKFARHISYDVSNYNSQDNYCEIRKIKEYKESKYQDYVY